MEAFASFFRSIERKSQKKYYGATAEILNILPPLKEVGDSDNLSKALVALIELTEIAPTMFKALFHSLVQFSIAVIQDKDLSDQVRQNALELMATFADYNAAMCKKDLSYTSDMVTQCLSLMTDIGMDDDDAVEWNASEDVRRLSLHPEPPLILGLARCRRKRSQSCSWGAMYGPPCQQAWRPSCPPPYLQLAATNDAVISVERSACCTYGYLGDF